MNNREYMKAWRKKKLLQDPDYRKREHKKYRAAHLEELTAKSRVYRSRPEYKEYARTYAEERTRSLRYQILSHYSGSDQPYCNKCGFDDIRGLCVDHINNDGCKDKRANQTLHLWMIKNNYPEGYQVLCANCNTIKEMDRR